MYQTASGEYMNNRIIRPKKIIGYNRGAGFFSALRQSAMEHSYNGNLGSLVYVTKRFVNYTRHVIARFMPFNRIRVSLHKARGVNIGKNVQIGPLVFIDEPFPEYVYIDDDAAIANGTFIIAHVKPPIYQRRNLESYVQSVVIEKGAWVGACSIILSGVTVGEGSIVTAGSVVSRDVSPYTVVAGNPARLVSKLKKG